MVPYLWALPCLRVYSTVNHRPGVDVAGKRCRSSFLSMRYLRAHAYNVTTVSSLSPPPPPQPSPPLYWQLVDPGSLLVPPGHALQTPGDFARLALLNVLAGHSSQNCAPVWFWNVPRKHELHRVLPSKLTNVPAAHGMHPAMLVCMRAVLNVPLGHGLHSACPRWSW